MDKESGRWRGQAWKAAEAKAAAVNGSRAEVDGDTAGRKILRRMLKLCAIVMGLFGSVVIIFMIVFMVWFLMGGAEVTEEDRQAAERYDRQAAEHQAATADPRAVAERVCVAPIDRAARRLGGEMLLNEADRRRRFRFERLWPEHGRKFPELRWRANDLPGPYPRDARRLAVVSGSGMVFNGGFAGSPVGPGDDWLGPNRRLVERGLSMWLKVKYSCTLDVSVNPARVRDVDVSATKTMGYDQICTYDMQTCTDVRE